MSKKRCPTKVSGLEVIGAGLPRTGTTSLMLALDTLGYAPCHKYPLLADEWVPYRKSQMWQQACLIEDRETRQKILRKLYEDGRFRAACDWPTSLFVDDLVEMYPQAKFILGLRSSPEAWRKSVNETLGWFHGAALYYSCYLIPYGRYNILPVFHNGCIRDRRRHNGVDILAPKNSVEIYHRHNELVRKVVPKERLLEFRPGDGWGPLCEFLCVPVPTDGQGEVLPFPRANDSAHQRREYWMVMGMGLSSWALLLGSVYGVVRYLATNM